MCAEAEGGSVSVSESHNSGVQVYAWSVCVSVCEIDGAGEDRGDTLVDAETTAATWTTAATPFTSEPSSVRLSGSFLFL